MTGIFLQARLASTRFPRKALRVLGNRTIVEHCMASLGYVRADYHVLLTDRSSASELSPLAEQWGFDVFIGSHDDVLDRYARAADRYGVDTIVRATGDNPLVSAGLANRILAEHQQVASDYSGYLGMPLGTGVEVLSRRALMKADNHAQTRYEREHVAPYIYGHPWAFRTHRPVVERSLQSDARVTIDLPSDLENVRILYDRLYRGLPIEVHEIVTFFSGYMQPHQQSA
ncbi:MAG: cytidylyltransferase domain-containing protein [Spirochaetales bacterium]